MRDQDLDDRLIDLTIILIIVAVIGLKLTGVITVSWFWLLCPIWGLFGIGIILTVILLLVFIGTSIMNKYKRRTNK